MHSYFCTYFAMVDSLGEFLEFCIIFRQRRLRSSLRREDGTQQALNSPGDREIWGNFRQRENQGYIIDEPTSELT